MNYLELLEKLRSDKPLRKEELEALLFWMQSDQGRRLVMEDILHEWNAFETTATYDYQGLLQKINRKIDTLSTQRALIVRKRLAILIRYAVEAAAIVLLVIGITFFMNTRVEKRYHQYVETLTPEKVEIYNPKGLKTILILPDSSKVILNADSKISYYKNFLPDERPVYLEGEAFFEVTKDAQRPFVVHINSATLTVLGTSFNVRAYPEDKSIETTLLSGALRIGYGRAHSTLKPGDHSSVDRASEQITVKEIDPTESTGWITGKLYFRQTLFSDIVATLQRSFNVNIRVDNPALLQRNFTGKFEHGENLDTVLEVLRLSASFTNIYDKENNMIIIK